MSWVAVAVGTVGAVGAGASYMASKENKNASTTTQTESRTPQIKDLARTAWNQYINDYYGTDYSSWAKNFKGIAANQLLPEQTALASYKLDIANQKLRDKVAKEWEKIRTAAIKRGETPPDLAQYMPQDQVYNTAGSGTDETRKSAKQRIYENVAGQKEADQAYLDRMAGLDTTHLSGVNAAYAPYQTQLTDVLNQSQQGTGYFSPVRLSFGGQPVASFVPRQNRELANQSLGIGKESAGIGTALADLLYGTGQKSSSAKLAYDTAHPVNEAADYYARELEKLALLTNSGSRTDTTTGTAPGMSGWDAVAQAAGSAASGLGAYYGAGGGFAPASAPAPVQYGGNIGTQSLLGNKPVFTPQQFY